MGIAKWATAYAATPSTLTGRMRLVGRTTAAITGSMRKIGMLRKIPAIDPFWRESSTTPLAPESAKMTSNHPAATRYPPASARATMQSSRPQMKRRK